MTPERHVQDFLAVCRLAQAKELTIDQVYFSVQEYSPPHNLTPRTDQLVDCWALLVLNPRPFPAGHVRRERWQSRGAA